MSRLITASLAALAVLAGSFGSASAVDGADYVVWRWDGPGPRGMGVIDGTSNTIMRAVVIKLQQRTEYRIVASSVGCAKPHGASPEIMSASFESNGRGTAFAEALPDDGFRLADARSVRLLRGSNQVDCARAQLFDAADPAEPAATEQVAFTLLKDNSRTVGMLMVDLGSGNDTLTFVLHGLEPEADHRLVGSDVQCPEAPSDGARLFRRTFTSSARGARYDFHTRTNLASALPASVHLFEVGAGRLLCALLIPVVQA